MNPLHCSIRFQKLKFLSNLIRAVCLSSSSSLRIQRKDINVFNTLTRCKEPLSLQNSNNLYWYSCGPTVYDSAHIGHACSYVSFDILKRILTSHFKINVINVLNITDIDDKIINRSVREKKSFEELTKHYEKEFFDDLSLLNCERPSIVLRVTQHVDEIVTFIGKLIERDLAYVTSSGSVYFNSQSFNVKSFVLPVVHNETTTAIDDQESSERKEKRHAHDFALWKSRKSESEPTWPSPWSHGRPGWHIECSTLASIAFGEHLDIHSGGRDLIFPHHQNELIQCCAYYDRASWSSHWLHTGHLHLRGDVKMSKSLSNTISIRELLERYTSNQFRYFCLLSTYRNDKEFSDEQMLKPVAIDYSFSSFLNNCKLYCNNMTKATRIDLDESKLFEFLASTRDKIDVALGDDFNTPLVVHELHVLASTVNALFQRSSSSSSSSSMELLLRSPVDQSSSLNRHYACLMSVSNYISSTLTMLGLNYTTDDLQSATSTRQAVNLNNLMDTTLKLRKSIRTLAKDKSISNEIRSKMFQICDDFRNELAYANIELKDSKTETIWQIKANTGKKSN